MIKRLSLAIVILASVSACGTRSSSSVTPTLGAGDVAPVAAPKNPHNIPVLETDITDRKYHSLGDISTTVSKWSLFDSDPTPAKVNEALQKKAAEMGADAVILVRYGAVGMGVFTWGKLDGNGRAIVFDR